MSIYVEFGTKIAPNTRQSSYKILKLSGSSKLKGTTRSFATIVSLNKNHLMGDQTFLFYMDKPRSLHFYVQDNNGYKQTSAEYHCP